MKTYLVIWYYVEPQSDGRCREVVEALGDKIAWDIIDPVCCAILVRWKGLAKELGEWLVARIQPPDKLLIMAVADNTWYGLTRELAAKYLLTPPLVLPSVPQKPSEPDSPRTHE